MRDGLRRDDGKRLGGVGMTGMRKGAGRRRRGHEQQHRSGDQPSDESADASFPKGHAVIFDESDEIVNRNTTRTAKPRPHC